VITAIVDLSHHEAACVPLLGRAKEQGLVAVITKCTEGRDFVDPSYAPMRKAARDADLLVGSYHFGTNSDSLNDDGKLGREQADHFLAHADPDGLLILDWEWSEKHRDMTLANAEAFVARVHEKTGRYVVIYTSRSFLTHDLVPKADSVLSQCPLWLCWYLDAHPAKHLPRAPWKQHDLWQYTNGHAGPADEIAFPRKTPVLGRVDRNAFAGDERALREWWEHCGRDPGPQCR
jgi:lysozyme